MHRIDRVFVRSVILGLAIALVGLGVAACTPIMPEAGGTAPAPAAAAGLQPGDQVGSMVMAQGPVPFDLNLPPLVAFCNPNPQVPLGATVAVPGEYTVRCTVPPLPQMMIGFGVAGRTTEEKEHVWDVTPADLYVNDQLVDQPAFGLLDTEIPVTGMPGQDAGEVVNLQLRVWNVVLENVTPGEFTMRQRIASTAEVFDGDITWPQGVYDITYLITVDEAMAAAGGEPEPVTMYQQPQNVFEAFTAAVNAHDVDAALALFAPDAVAAVPALPPPNTHTGTDELRAWLQNDADDNIHVEITDAQTVGDIVSAQASVGVDSLPPGMMLGGTVELTVQDGKIKAFLYTLDDATVEKLGALEAQ